MASTASDLSGEASVVRQQKLLIPGCAPTSSLAREFSLLMAIRTWNTPVLPLQCCPFHSALRELRASSRLCTHILVGKGVLAPHGDPDLEHPGLAAPMLPVSQRLEGVAGIVEEPRKVEVQADLCPERGGAVPALRDLEPRRRHGRGRGRGNKTPVLQLLPRLLHQTDHDPAQ
mmetsp:Transcript_7620/g.19374  ORF Transcript_7620/g.19374 Transcript_7620/m.19374 type:complete len:173 (-) Transcript_7620:92-610(-)